MELTAAGAIHLVEDCWPGGKRVELQGVTEGVDLLQGNYFSHSFLIVSKSFFPTPLYLSCQMSVLK